MRMGRGVATGLALSVLLATNGVAATLSDRFDVFLQGGLAPVADSFARAVGRSVPVVAASPSYRYEFDPETGAYSTRRSTGGQLFLEHAEPLGQGHLALGVDYLHVQFDRLDGKPLRELSDPYPRVESLGRPLFSIPRAEIDVAADQVLFSATYGVFGWLDVNAVVPVVYTQLHRVDVIRVFQGDLGTVQGHSSDSATGVGDLQLRAKAQLVTAGSGGLAAGLGLRIPTGQEGDFHGTGDLELTPSLIASTPNWEPAPGVRLQGHLNLAMLLDVDDVGGRSEGRWGLGLDLGFARWQLAVGLLGREPTGPIFSSAEIDALTKLTCVGTPAQCDPVAPASRVEKRTLFGFSGDRPNYVDGSIGLRVALWEGRLTAVVGMLAPLLDQGLITDPIPVIGIEGVL